MALDHDECARLDEIIAAVGEIRLIGWDKNFFEDVCAKYEEKGAELFLTGRQWQNLERLYAKA